MQSSTAGQGQAGRDDQTEVVAFLGDPASYPTQPDRVERFEMHGALVFLAGEEAWKIKRAVRFAYMDFSTLAKRKAVCAREVEINRRFRPRSISDAHRSRAPLTADWNSMAAATSSSGPCACAASIRPSY